LNSGLSKNDTSNPSRKDYWRSAPSKLNSVRLISKETVGQFSAHLSKRTASLFEDVLTFEFKLALGTP
jgi:hypothetical protein